MQIYSYFVSKLLFFLPKTGSTGQSTGLMVVEPGMVASVTITHWIFQIEFSNFYTKYPHVFTTNGNPLQEYHRECVYILIQSHSQCLKWAGIHRYVNLHFYILLFGVPGLFLAHRHFSQAAHTLLYPLHQWRPRMEKVEWRYTRQYVYNMWMGSTGHSADKLMLVTLECEFGGPRLHKAGKY